MNVELDDRGTNSLPLRVLAAELEELGRKGFRDRYPCGFLLLSLSPTQSKLGLEFQTLQLPGQQPGPRKGRVAADRAIPLLKTDRNARRSKIMVGRQSTNDVIIRSSNISKEHACLHLTLRKSYKVQDLGSTNGTRVNGVKLTGKKKQSLTTGDLVLFWQYLFEFVSLSALIKRLGRR